MTTPKIAQQFDATAVALAENVVDVAVALPPEASGCPVCNAPVYEDETPKRPEVELPVTTTLLAPVAGAIRYQSDTQSALVFCTEAPILVIATPLYVTPLTTSGLLEQATTNKIRFVPEHVCDQEIDAGALKLLVPTDDASKAIAIAVFWCYVSWILSVKAIASPLESETTGNVAENAMLPPTAS